MQHRSLDKNNNQMLNVKLIHCQISKEYGQICTLTKYSLRSYVDIAVWGDILRILQTVCVFDRA